MPTSFQTHPAHGRGFSPLKLAVSYEYLMCVVDYSALLFLETVARPLATLIWGFLLYKLVLKSLNYKAQQLMGRLKAEVLG